MFHRQKSHCNPDTITAQGIPTYGWIFFSRRSPTFVKNIENLVADKSLKVNYPSKLSFDKKIDNEEWRSPLQKTDPFEPYKFQYADLCTRSLCPLCTQEILPKKPLIDLFLYNNSFLKLFRKDVDIQFSYLLTFLFGSIPYLGNFSSLLTGHESPQETQKSNVL